jgi:hypothetical protein
VKILFVGPTLYGDVRDGRLAAAPEIECRGPAAQGDIAKAVLAGATAIGLVDGRYEDVAAPWHKEILFGLSEGVAMLGAGSLGALRAAECAAFGMIGVGLIYERLAAGDIIDDSDVAQLHAPAEMGYLPLTEAFVNVDATLRNLAASHLLDQATSLRLAEVGRSIFFKQLTFERIFELCALPGTEGARLATLVLANRIDLKRQDAMTLVRRMGELPSARGAKPATWQMAQPIIWQRFISELQGRIEHERQTAA